MGRVVVHVEAVHADDLQRLVADAIDAVRSTPGLEALADADVVAEPDQVRKNGKTPSEHYSADLQEKLKSARFEAVTPGDVVAWWASRFRSTFKTEDPALQAVRAFTEHERVVRQALRRFHEGKAKALLQYLTAVLRWWSGRRERQDRRARGWPRLRHVVQSDWLIGLWQSGDMGRDVDADAGR